MSDIREILRGHANDYEAHLEKEMARRVQVLIQDEQLFAVYRKFGGEIFRRSSVLYGIDDFLKQVNAGGRLCLEIGTCHGLTAIVLSRYFDHVFSIDIFPSDFKQGIIDYLGIKNITFITKPSDAVKNAWIEIFLKDRRIDMAFLDGDHARYTKSDFALVKDCPAILFDEAWPPQPPVWDLVNMNMLPREEVNFGAFRMAYWNRK